MERARELDKLTSEYEAESVLNVPKKTELYRNIGTRHDLFEKLCSVYGCPAALAENTKTYAATMESFNRHCETKGEKAAKERKQKDEQYSREIFGNAPQDCAEIAKRLDASGKNDPSELRVFQRFCSQPLRCLDYESLTPKPGTFSGQWAKISELCKKEFPHWEENYNLLSSIRIRSRNCPELEDFLDSQNESIEESPLYMLAGAFSMKCGK